MRRSVVLFALALPVAACGAPDDRGPSAHDQRIAAEEDRPVQFVLDGDDVDGAPLTWTARQPAHGTFELHAPLATYTPDPDFHGTDHVEVTVAAGDHTASAIIVFEVAAIDDPPIARADTFAVPEGETLSLTTRAVLANDLDVDGDGLRVIALAAIDGGTIELGDEEIIYTPSPDRSGDVRFAYTVTDGIGQATGEVTLRRGPSNHAPIATDDVIVTDEDEPVAVPQGELLRNDRDPDGDTFSIIEIRDEVGGRAALDAGVVRFVPSADFHGDGGFAYWISDGRAERRAWVTVAVTGIDDPPVARPVAIAGVEDQPLVIPVSELRAHADDGDGDPLVVIAVGEPSTGSVGLIGGEVRFSPARDATGAAGFTYTVSDGVHESSARVAITLAAVDDLPVAFPQLRATTEGVALDVTLTGHDVDSAPLGFLVVERPRHGILASRPGVGELRYIPEPGFAGDDELVFVAEAGGLVSAPERVILRVEVVGCGDGDVDPGEACDDGNQLDGDGCDRVCSVTACGNGIVGSPPVTAVTLRWLGATCAEADQAIELAVDGVIVLSVPGGDGACGCDEPVRSATIADPAALAWFTGHAALDLRLAGHDARLAWAELAVTAGGIAEVRPLYSTGPRSPDASSPAGLCETVSDTDVAASTTWILGEECDDGNLVAGDGCSAECAIE